MQIKRKTNTTHTIKSPLYIVLFPAVFNRNITLFTQNLLTEIYPDEKKNYNMNRIEEIKEIF